MRELIEAAGRVAALLRAARARVAVAESSSGGLVSAALLAVPGASDYFLGGAVVYTGVARGLVGIDAAAMGGLRSSSEPYAALLAETVRERHGAAWGLAETGAAGPTGNRYGDAAGHTCLAVAGARSAATTLETGHGDRVANMFAFAAAALALLERQLRAGAAA